MNHLVLKSLILASQAPGEAPVVVPRPQQAAHLQALLDELTAAGVRAHTTNGTEHPSLVIDADQRRRMPYSYDHFYVSFSKEGVREISSSYHDDGVPMTSLAQLTRLLQQAGERVEEVYARQLKRTKIRRLKERSIETQVEELARRLGFAYALEKMHTKLKLYVRINARDTVVVDIPHKTLQETVDRLEPLLLSVRELAKVGLRFQMTSTPHVRHLRQPGGPAQPDFAAGKDEDEDDAADAE